MSVGAFAPRSPTMAAEVPSGTSPFGPAAAKAKAADATPGPSFGMGPFKFGPGGSASSAAPVASPAAPPAGPALAGHTLDPSPRQVAEAIETMAARLGEALTRLGQMQDTILAQQSRINQLESRRHRHSSWLSERPP